MNSLDPVWRIRNQLREVLCRRGNLTRKAADARAIELFRAVGLDPARLGDYPHQFSGGMRQRVAIALALALRPRLVVADEPVTALDVIVQRQILETLRGLAAELNLAGLVVTHDVSVVAFRGALAGRAARQGCRLRDRCPHAFARCAIEEPPLVEVAPGHLAACHLA